MARIVEESAEAPGRRRRRREETREALIVAALEIIEEYGPGSLTTVNVTKAAGLAQSGFYAHFRDVDDLKQAAAEVVAGEVRQFLTEQYRQRAEGQPADPEGLSVFFRAVIGLYLSHGHLPELLAPCRLDASPLGDVMRSLLADLRTGLVAATTRQLQRLGVAQPDPARVGAYAEFVVAMGLAAGEGILGGRVGDPEALARDLALAALGAGKAMFFTL
jgi:AcrR family transcriptional regulator